jgi:hypothetical protein
MVEPAADRRDGGGGNRRLIGVTAAVETGC